MRRKSLLIVVALLTLGQIAVAQSGKQITAIQHDFNGSANSELGTGSESATFTYDAQGRPVSGHLKVSSANGGNEEVNATYTYDDAAQTINGTMTLTFSEMPPGMFITVTADAKLENGLLKETLLTTNVPMANVEYDKSTYEYDAEGYVTKVSTSDMASGSGNESQEIVWADGNVTSWTSTRASGSTKVTTFTYDMSQPGPKNPYVCMIPLQFSFGLTGMMIMMPVVPYMGLMPKNLITSQTSKDKVLTLAYEYDGDGDVSKLEVFVNGSKTDTFTFGLSSSGISELRADDKEAPYYTLDGCRVTAPGKGIYIHNGRKVLVK